jgi:RNA 3'-terminal phosphate cyclase (ATP)
MRVLGRSGLRIQKGRLLRVDAAVNRKKTEMIEIDGAIGEGGGQVLRSSLTMSMMTGQDLRIANIRAKRKKPGLRPQHLVSLQASAEICGGSVEGDTIGSTEITFFPGEIKAGKYHFDIGTAGSTSLVLQTLLLPLCKVNKPSTVTIRGGTHVPWSPCFHYLDLHYLPFLWQMGLDVHLRMERAGFYPRGGGQIRAVIEPGTKISPLTLLKRGRLREIRGLSAVANLTRNIATRQRRQVIGRLGRRFPLNDIRIADFQAASPGSVILLLADFEFSQVCYFSLGKKGLSADKVADKAIGEFEAFFATDGVIDQYLADQMLLPLAFGAGPSEFHTCQITQHLVTNAAVIQAFLAVAIMIDGMVGEPGRVTIKP